jgi:hypothetical protein
VAEAICLVFRIAMTSAIFSKKVLWISFKWDAKERRSGLHSSCAFLGICTMFSRYSETHEAGSLSKITSPSFKL